jgi:bacterioferritin-associated ferredoxin
MIVCICRGTSDREINKVIDRGASSLRDLQRCGVGDQCGSCHSVLREMIAVASAARAHEPCAACSVHTDAPVAAMV